jgi:hypothetical protein
MAVVNGTLVAASTPLYPLVTPASAVVASTNGNAEVSLAEPAILFDAGGFFAFTLNVAQGTAIDAAIFDVIAADDWTQVFDDALASVLIDENYVIAGISGGSYDWFNPTADGLVRTDAEPFGISGDITAGDSLSVDLVAQIQALVNLPGWQSGDIVLIATGPTLDAVKDDDRIDVAGSAHGSYAAPTLTVTTSTFNITITASPSQAITDGAEVAYDATAFFPAPKSYSLLYPVAYTAKFSAVTGWITPADQPFTSQVYHQTITGVYIPNHYGPFEADMPMMEAAFSGGLKHTGDFAADMPMMTADLEGGLKQSGPFDADMPMMTADFAGIVGGRGPFAADMPMMIAAFEGNNFKNASFAADMPMMIAAFVGKTNQVLGQFAADMPMMTADFAGGKRISTGFLIVKRFDDTDLAGVEDITLMDTFNNAIAGSDFTEAESAAGASHYAGKILWNQHPSATLEDVFVWIDSDSFAGIQIASEAVVAGAIQSIANEATSPTGRSWVSPSAHSGALDLGNILPGAGMGLWREITIGVGASASSKELVALRYAFTLGSSRYELSKRGLFRIAATQATPYSLYMELGVDPDPEVDTPVAVDADGIFSSVVGPLAEGIWHAGFTETDKFGLESGISKIQILPINAAGDETQPPPIAPDAYTLTPSTSGAVLVTASYLPIQEPDQDYRATHWAIFASYDGSDPELATPIVEAMNFPTSLNIEKLSYSLPAQIDQAPVRVIVRARRLDATVVFDSLNTRIATATAVKIGAPRMRGEASYGLALGTFIPKEHVSSTTTLYVDVSANIYFEISEGSVEFWMDTDLVWRRISDGDEQTLYIPSEFAIETHAVSGTGTEEVIEVVTPTKLYLCANAERVIEVDSSAMTIRASEWNFSDLDSIGIAVDTPAWGRFADSLFSCFDADLQNNSVYLRVVAGKAYVSASVDHTLAQAAIEVL